MALLGQWVSWENYPRISNFNDINITDNVAQLELCGRRSITSLSERGSLWPCHSCQPREPVMKSWHWPVLSNNLSLGRKKTEKGKTGNVKKRERQLKQKRARGRGKGESNRCKLPNDRPTMWDKKAWQITFFCLVSVEVNGGGLEAEVG